MSERIIAMYHHAPEPIEDLKALSDAAVLALSLKKSHAFAEIVGRYERAFVRKALSILGNEDDAYDVVQETFVRIYAAASRYEEQAGASFKSWAYTILVNQCYTAYAKAKKRRTVSFEQEPELLEVIPDEAVAQEHESKLTREYVLRLVSKLPELLRRAVTLHFLEGKPQKEVAELEGVSNNVIRARIHRAKKELRKIDGGMKVAQIAL